MVVICVRFANAVPSDDVKLSCDKVQPVHVVVHGFATVVVVAADPHGVVVVVVHCTAVVVVVHVADVEVVPVVHSVVVLTHWA